VPDFQVPRAEPRVASRGSSRPGGHGRCHAHGGRWLPRVGRRAAVLASGRWDAP
jgi:hypothetical protein